jgi:hypothetical protein
VMTQVDLGLIGFDWFDSTDPVVSVNDGNQKPGASQPTPLRRISSRHSKLQEEVGNGSGIEVLPKKFSWLCST